ncbi:hypothetical protein CWI42_080970 [Ordospora colligata]|uniref:Uncharacterized protein n=1 Tax=Ordospora colligata OC4 TaxID=1354746 RepID=A0A0B2UE58_9MICR|nr:uncharacterized protein M896_080970 [Ordospora colligata OC4]KHN69361.1 hypothetical protein M896_080970 [Ordospora colligata OC4]TBU14875.1 hypothetical protein CWI41_080960 [Ordospora colligata]TBU15006.1 hypothetical protein CWI40_080980 [Ordospora colligata]TBU18260.1 hypothetical protein CWI42_080970 [Ordospora colligata]
MGANKSLRSDECKEVLVEALELHIKNHGFDKQINEFLDNAVYAKMHDAININEVFEMLHKFVVDNLPPDIQQGFYCDVKNFISENVTTDE